MYLVIYKKKIGTACMRPRHKCLVAPLDITKNLQIVHNHYLNIQKNKLVSLPPKAPRNYIFIGRISILEKNTMTSDIRACRKTHDAYTNNHRIFLKNDLKKYVIFVLRLTH